MKIIADTNLIVRVLTRDDPRQFEVAGHLLETAETVVFPVVALCETVWVLTRAVKWPGSAVARALRVLLDDPKVLFDQALVERGLAMLDDGGDFADAVVAADGRRFADATFATFDRDAARLLTAQGSAVTLLA